MSKYIPFLPVEPEVFIETALDALGDNLVIANTVTQRSDLGDYKPGTVITQRVKGTLPVRNYGFNNNRENPIITDTYEETAVNFTMSADRPYSAVQLTDEQKIWDFKNGWGDLPEAQIAAISGHFERGVLGQIFNAPYEVRIVVKDSAVSQKAAAEMNQDSIFNSINEATTAIKRMRTPDLNLYAACGLEFANAIRQSNKLIKNQGAGENAFASSVIGTYDSVTFIESTAIPATEAVMYASTGYIFYTQAAPVPDALVGRGAVARTTNGVALRWLNDYDSSRWVDRSSFDVFAGYQYTKDYISLYDTTRDSVVVGTDQPYFVRGLRLKLESSFGSTTDATAFAKHPGDGKTDTPGGAVDSFLAKAWNLQTIDGKPLTNASPWNLWETPAASAFAQDQTTQAGVTGQKTSKTPAEALADTTPDKTPGK